MECDIAKELDGFTYDTLPQALKIKLKRSFVRVEVIRKESDQRLRYYMFKRLNTGGETLSEQEVRNCTIRLLSGTFIDFIADLTSNAYFAECIENISDEQRQRRYDQELVLRFFAFKNYRNKYVHDVGDFMTEYMEAVSDPGRGDVPFTFDDEKAVFVKTFEVLSKTLGPQIFSRMNKQGNLVSTFLSYHYEAFTLGIQPYLALIDPSDMDTLSKLTEVFMSVKRDSEFIRITTGGGKNYANPLKERIGFVERGVGALYGSS